MSVIVMGDIDWSVMLPVIGATACVIVLFGLAGAVLAENQNRDPLAGALLGMLFGPLGWLVIAAVGRRQS